MKRENKKTCYRECEIKYSVCENDGKYYADGCVYIHAEDTLGFQLPGSEQYDSFEEAEKDIKKQAEKLIDQKIKEKFRAIKNGNKK